MKRVLTYRPDDQDQDEGLNWFLTRCAGDVILECGPLSVRMSHRDLARINRLTEAAMVRFRIEKSTAEVVHLPTDATH